MAYEPPAGVAPPTNNFGAPNVPAQAKASYGVGGGSTATLDLQTVGQITQQHGVKVLVYGRPGLGKTRLICTAPNPVIFSAENGLLSLRAVAPHLPAWKISNVDDLERAHDWALGSSQAKQFDTICLDSISEIAEVCLIAEKAKNSKNGFAAYGALNDRIMAIFRDFRDFAHKHVYFVAKEEYDKDETGLSKFMPSMPGRTLTQQVPYMFDEIFRFEVYTDPSTRVSTRYLRTTPDQQNIAKDRSGRLDWAEPADLGAIFAKILA
jgi:hypothetical protein